jgi:hypothetical protein
MKVTKWLKPSGSASRIGDSASVRAATRVNAEQGDTRAKFPVLGVKPTEFEASRSAAYSHERTYGLKRPRRLTDQSGSSVRR